MVASTAPVICLPSARVTVDAVLNFRVPATSSPKATIPAPAISVAPRVTPPVTVKVLAASVAPRTIV